MEHNSPTTTTDSVVSGGPETTITAPNHVTQPETSTHSAPVQPASSQVFVGGRMFNSTEEALAYADQQSRKAQELEAKEALLKLQQQQKADVDPGDMIFDDPKAALRLQEQRILSQIDSRQKAAEQEKRVWTGFYETYPDLKGHEDLVDLNKFKNWDRIGNLPIEQSLPILAKEVRGHLAKIRGHQHTTTQRLPSGPATVMDAAGGNTHVAPIAAPGAPKTFVQELAEWKSGKRKTA